MDDNQLGDAAYEKRAQSQIRAFGKVLAHIVVTIGGLAIAVLAFAWLMRALEHAQ
jgi:hypothetical protein